MTTKMIGWAAVVGATSLIVGCGKSPETLEQDCSGGRAESCVVLGEMLLSGNDVAQDKSKAAMLFERACEARDIRGCDKARQIYEESCQGGIAGGCSLLGRMYLDGFGVGQDQAKAATLYEKACDLGDAVSCSNLGWMYSQGEGVTLDARAAADLWKKACEGGFADACKKVSDGEDQ